jgi:hypothetical protein
MRGFQRLGVAIGAILVLIALGFLGAGAWSHFQASLREGPKLTPVEGDPFAGEGGAPRWSMAPQVGKPWERHQSAQQPAAPGGHSGMFDDLIPSQESLKNDRNEYFAIGGLFLLFAAGSVATCWSVGWIVAGFFN